MSTGVVVNDNTTVYGYDGQMCAEEFFRGTIPGNSAVNDDSTRYTLGGRGIDMIEAVRVAGASGDNTVGAKHWSFPLYDGHGNTIATWVRSTNSYGYELTNEKRYDAWGSVKLQSSGAGGALVNPNEGYCGNIGHKRDGETDLIYMRARYYEPGTGRFISEDGHGDGQNWYSYCANNPINAQDPTGNYTVPIPNILWATGGVFLVLALLAMIKGNIASAAQKSFVGISVINIGKNPSGFYTTAQGLSTLAALFFGLAATGVTGVNAFVLTTIGGLLTAYTGAITILTSSAQTGARTQGAAAVFAAFTYGMVVLGYLLAADAATEV